MRRIVIIVLVALGTTVLAWGTAESFYFAKPIAGRVVEWGTSTGLQDVTVVADWQLQGGLGGFDPRGHVVILETKTDADGRFAFPGWGPRFALPRGRLINRDPMLLFFRAATFRASFSTGMNLTRGCGHPIGMARRCRWSPRPGGLTNMPTQCRTSAALSTCPSSIPADALGARFHICCWRWTGKERR